MSSKLLESSAFKALATHFNDISRRRMVHLFSEDSARASSFTTSAAGITLDYSKNRITHDTMALLMTLARERGVEARRDAMFAGEKINITEQRSVLHTALRQPATASLTIDGQNIIGDVHNVLGRMERFTDAVRSGKWTGFSGKKITDIVNIGIGGSDLGPLMACTALRTAADPALKTHFVSNVDGHDLAATLQLIDPETTLFIIASKTFTTLETMMNARSARQWLLRTAPESALPKHFVALSTNTDAVKDFGIDPENMFPFWDWVGGRYSVWSAIGLSVALAVGFDNFREFLAGAHAMDQHFLHAPIEQNLPVILGVIGVWYRNFFDFRSVSIAPYHHDLRFFPAYLQQLEMESNGKRVALDGSPVEIDTCPVIWGSAGTNGQHAYFQLLHQGTQVTPVDFIVALEASHSLPGHQSALLANCFAQSEAFMKGKSADQVRAEMQAAGVSSERIDQLAQHRKFPGNRPSNTLYFDQLTPHTLGALIALYEHKVLVQGTIWGVNSFDQWGVELGKVLAGTIQAELLDEAVSLSHDGSTNQLIQAARAALQRTSQ